MPGSSVRLYTYKQLAAHVSTEGTGAWERARQRRSARAQSPRSRRCTVTLARRVTPSCAGVTSGRGMRPACMKYSTTSRFGQPMGRRPPYEGRQLGARQRLRRRPWAQDLSPAIPHCQHAVQCSRAAALNTCSVEQFTTWDQRCSCWRRQLGPQARAAAQAPASGEQEVEQTSNSTRRGGAGRHSEAHKGWRLQGDSCPHTG